MYSNSTRKRPLFSLGSNDIHKRCMFADNSASEHRYFNMFQHVNAKPEVQE